MSDDGRIPSNIDPSRGARVGLSLVGLLWLAACPAHDPPLPAAPTAPAWPGLPLTLTFEQRSEHELPGTDGALRVRLGDVTGGRVEVTLVGPTGLVLQPMRFAAGDSSTFPFRGERFVVKVESLHNALVGEDFATLVFSEWVVLEPRKIERLLDVIAFMKGTVFIRNGEEHSAAEAAEHLRRKWEARRESIETAREFIDVIATRSSLSDEPYRLRFPDGRVVEAGPYFHERLSEIERTGG